MLAIDPFRSTNPKGFLTNDINPQTKSVMIVIGYDVVCLSLSRSFLNPMDLGFIVGVPKFGTTTIVRTMVQYSVWENEVVM